MKRSVIISAIAMAFMLTACGRLTIKTNGFSVTLGGEQETKESLADNASSEMTALTDGIIQTDLIQVTLPEELRDLACASTDENTIDIYDRALVDEGYPGLVFSIGISSDCDVFAGGMYTKEGEIFGEDGTVYNVGKGYASEIQWDPEKPDMPESYRRLYDAADGIMENISGVGDNFYVYKSGTRGEELYTGILDKYITAISDRWSPDQFEEEEMSGELGVIAANAEDPFERIGFAYMDINGDGIDELLIGNRPEKAFDGMLYDIYTMVDREPAHVVSGYFRDRYYALGGFDVCNEYSAGAGETGTVLYVLIPNSTELFLQIAYKCDEYENEESPWFKAYNDGEWEAVSEEEYNDALKQINEDKLIPEYTPFSHVIGIDFSQMDMSRFATFTQLVDNLYPGMAYANVTLNDTDALFVANGCYDNLDGNHAAIDSSVFIYDKDGNVVFLGTVQSGGTANPLAVKDGNLYVAGHHFVIKCTIGDGELVLREAAYEDFDSEGNASYYYGTAEDGGYRPVDDDSFLNRLFEEAMEAEIIDFQEVFE